jgi:AGCS family alanine or glycine:cation symporter
MAIAYLLSGLVVLAINIQEIPAAIVMVFEYAFTPVAAQGGFAGAAVWAAMRFGIARGIFSNEAGLGSAPIAHASAQTGDPIRQGLIAMLGTFIDTIIVCSITGLVILSSGVWQSGESGAALTSLAFGTALPIYGNHMVGVALALFAFTTLIGWSFYGERCAAFLFGVKVIIPYRVFWILVIPLGAMVDLEFIWLVADTLNALMALPNLIALALLSPVVFTLTKKYFQSKATPE